MKNYAKNKKVITYKYSGVDIDKADKLISNLNPLIKKTYNKAVIKNFGGFSSILDLKQLGYKDPLLMSTTDGVGTKLQLALKTNNLYGIGIDLVAMCANDIVAQGGLPHFFMDYIATGKLETEQLTEIIKGIIKGCQLADCALVGGETAEMPDHYSGGSLDLAGFCIGASERENVFNINDINEKNIVIAVESSGFHSNGYSLIRKIITEKLINLEDKTPFDKNLKFREILLKPTFIYSTLFKKIKSKIKINGITHITGGGLMDNPPRTFSKNLKIIIDLNSYQISDMYRWVKEEANLSWMELLRTFNCGIGLLIYLDKKDGQKMINLISHYGFKAWIVGEIKKNQNKENVEFIGIKD